MHELTSIAVYCADIGSIKKGNFGWAREAKGEHPASGTDIARLVDAIVADVNADIPVALGFECPLYVPISEDPASLTSQRPIDAGRPWSAGAGAGALATGLTETVWILQQARKRIESPPPVFVNWEDFIKAERGLFVWEAMVTGKAKGTSHEEDAAIAVRAFRVQMAGPEAGHREKAGRVHSLIGAALLRSGWTADLSLLAEPCVVINA